MSITWFHMKIINMVEILKWSWHFLGRLSDFWQKNWLALKFLGIFSESSNVYTRTPYSGWGQYEPLVSTQTPCISLTRGSLSWLVATREADTRGLSWYSGFVFCPRPSLGPGIDTMLPSFSFSILSKDFHLTILFKRITTNDKLFDNENKKRVIL